MPHTSVFLLVICVTAVQASSKEDIVAAAWKMLRGVDYRFLKGSMEDPFLRNYIIHLKNKFFLPKVKTEPKRVVSGVPYNMIFHIIYVDNKQSADGLQAAIEAVTSPVRPDLTTKTAGIEIMIQEYVQSNYFFGTKPSVYNLLIGISQAVISGDLSEERKLLNQKFPMEMVNPKAQEWAETSATKGAHSALPLNKEVTYRIDECSPFSTYFEILEFRNLQRDSFIDRLEIILKDDPQLVPESKRICAIACDECRILSPTDSTIDNRHGLYITFGLCPKPKKK